MRSMPGAEPPWLAQQVEKFRFTRRQWQPFQRCQLPGGVPTDQDEIAVIARQHHAVMLGVAGDLLAGGDGQHLVGPALDLHCAAFRFLPRQWLALHAGLELAGGE